MTQTETRCECWPCTWCKGSRFNYELLGEVSREHPCDDLADIIPCEECDGSGVAEVCDYCRDDEENYP